jgi:hypothetical protein
LSYWFTDQFVRAFEKVEGNRPIVAAVILAAASGLVLYKFLAHRRVATGDPKDFPVIGKQVADISHQLHVKMLKPDAIGSSALAQLTAEEAAAEAAAKIVADAPGPAPGTDKR